MVGGGDWALYISSWFWWHRPAIPATQGAKARVLLVQGMHGLLDEFQANLGNIMKYCLFFFNLVLKQKEVWGRVLLCLACTETRVQSEEICYRGKKGR